LTKEKIFKKIIYHRHWPTKTTVAKTQHYRTSETFSGVQVHLIHGMSFISPTGWIKGTGHFLSQWTNKVQCCYLTLFLLPRAESQTYSTRNTIRVTVARCFSLRTESSGDYRVIPGAYYHDQTPVQSGLVSWVGGFRKG